MQCSWIIPKPVPGARLLVGECCARVCFSVFGVPRICRTSFLQMCPLSQYGRCRIKYMCVCVFVYIYIYIFVCLCLMAHIETICLETLIPFRLVFLFKASFMFLVCIICHRTFPFVFNDDPSYCKMSGCDSFFPWLCFLSAVLHVWFAIVPYRFSIL